MARVPSIWHSLPRVGRGTLRNRSATIHQFPDELGYAVTVGPQRKENMPIETPAGESAGTGPRAPWPLAREGIRSQQGADAVPVPATRCPLAEQGADPGSTWLHGSIVCGSTAGRSVRQQQEAGGQLPAGGGGVDGGLLDCTAARGHFPGECISG